MFDFNENRTGPFNHDQTRAGTLFRNELIMNRDRERPKEE